MLWCIIANVLFTVRMTSSNLIITFTIIVGVVIIIIIFNITIVPVVFSFALYFT